MRNLFSCFQHVNQQQHDNLVTALIPHQVVSTGRTINVNSQQQQQTPSTTPQLAQQPAALSLAQTLTQQQQAQQQQVVNQQQVIVTQHSVAADSVQQHHLIQPGTIVQQGPHQVLINHQGTLIQLPADGLVQHLTPVNLNPEQLATSTAAPLSSVPLTQLPANVVSMAATMANVPRDMTFLNL